MKQIEGYDNYYVNQIGEVFSDKPSGMKKLKTSLRNGYPYVQLSKDGNRVNKDIHRLVAETFLDNPQSKSDVCHKNHDKTDNRLENLTWGTRSENMQMSADDDRLNKYNRPLRQKIRAMYSTGNYTKAHLGRLFNIPEHTIGRIINEER